MSSGRFHIQAGLVSWGLLTALAHKYCAPVGTVLLSAGYFTGVVWLSPDIDGWHQIPCKNWGPLKVIWIPYQSTHGHRSIQLRHLLNQFNYRGHWPLIGSAERLLYLSFWVGAAVSVVYFLDLAPDWALRIIPTIPIEQLQAMVAVFWFGNEAASLFHIFCDYCPGVRHMGYQ